MKICKYCGARLDSGESCDCRGVPPPALLHTVPEQKFEWTYLGGGKFMCGACARLFEEPAANCPACGAPMRLLHIIGEEIWFCEKREREEKERKWQPESGTTGSNSKNLL